MLMRRDAKVPGITVGQVCRELNVETEKTFMWSIGHQVRINYKREFGRDPEYDLRIKTCGRGKHVFAIYPEERWRDLARWILAAGPEPSRQMKLL